MSARKVWRSIKDAFKAELGQRRNANPWPKCPRCFRRTDPMWLCRRCGACDGCCIKCDTCNRCVLACQGNCAKEEK